MAGFDEAVRYVLEKEGGDKLTDDPSDPGGLTRYGISLRSYPSLGRDGIKNLTEEDAITIYHRDYWTPLHCDELPYPIALMLFDCAVNQGQPSAGMILQHALNVKADGVIGPVTIEAANKADKNDLLKSVTTFRILRYSDAPNWPNDRHGWVARTIETLIKATASV